jgi:hypothetical protein
VRRERVDETAHGSSDGSARRRRWSVISRPSWNVRRTTGGCASGRPASLLANSKIDLSSRMLARLTLWRPAYWASFKIASARV